jgi:hypothetical protein
MIYQSPLQKLFFYLLYSISEPLASKRSSLHQYPHIYMYISYKSLSFHFDFLLHFIIFSLAALFRKTAGTRPKNNNLFEPVHFDVCLCCYEGEKAKQPDNASFTWMDFPEWMSYFKRAKKRAFCCSLSLLPLLPTSPIEARIRRKESLDMYICTHTQTHQGLVLKAY